MSRVYDEPAVVLRVTPYRETSALLDAFTLNHGRMRAVVRGARGRRQRGSALQSFAFMRLGWFGRGPLVTLSNHESTRTPVLKGQRVAAGYYVLELIQRLTREWDAHPQLFVATSRVLEDLQESSDDHMEPLLRRFEKSLLHELGYGMDFVRESVSGRAIVQGERYVVHGGGGFVRYDGSVEKASIPGDVLLAIAADDFDDLMTRRWSRRLFRNALAPLLGPKPLASRQLLVRASAGS